MSQSCLSQQTGPAEEHPATPFQGECSSLTYLTLQLRTGPGGFYSNNWGANPTPDRAVTTKEEAPPNIQCRLWSPQHQTHPLSRGQWPARSEQSHGRHPHQIQPSHQKYWTYTVYKGMLPHKSSLSRPQYVTVSPKFLA